MNKQTLYTIRISLIVALGGFLMGFDASVISGVVKFIEMDFSLTKIQLGWAVSSLTLTSTLAMMLAGPLSNKIGRRTVLRYAAILYAISAAGSAIAPDFLTLVIARMLGGFGVGASLIIAPMYIAEIAPPKLRGRLVSFNQLNIVIGISAAFFTNYLILKWGQEQGPMAVKLGLQEHNWRWMLGIEAIPAILYFFFLFAVPRSPRWLIMRDYIAEARKTLMLVSDKIKAESILQNVQESISRDTGKKKVHISELFKPALRLVLTIGIVVAILQQITGINSVFFYAPMIFEQSGLGTNAAFSQAIWVGLTNLVFTILAIMFIDRFGRKLLLLVGVTGIALSMFALSWGFSQASYTLENKALEQIENSETKQKLIPLIGKTFESDVAFRTALQNALGQEDAAKTETTLIKEAIDINAMLILICILAFVASFAVSIGPVMWVLFSELFPNRVRALAISFAGLINSAVSFSVQLVFPWEIDTLGNSPTFLIYGIFAVAGLIFIIIYLPETKNKSLEELEQMLVRSDKS